MRIVRVVQMALHQVIRMIAVRYGIVAATRAVFVRSFVTSARMRFGALGGIRARDLDDVFVDVSFVHVMQMAVVKIIHVPFVLDFRMRTIGPMTMRMLVVRRMFHV